MSKWISAQYSVRQMFNISFFFPFHRKPVFVHEIGGRFDVGNLQSYVDCDQYFKDKLQNVPAYMM